MTGPASAASGPAINRVAELLEARCDGQDDTFLWLLNTAPTEEAVYGLSYAIQLVQMLADRLVGRDNSKDFLLGLLPGLTDDAAENTARHIIEEHLRDS